MSDISDFHNFALKSVLFKGRGDWYFCYVKAEKVAHVLTFIAASASAEHSLDDLTRAASALPRTITALAAGEIDVAQALADVFALLSEVRLAATAGMLLQENASVLAAEYEGIAARLMAGAHLSPFVSVQDFSVPPLPSPSEMKPPVPSFFAARTTAQAPQHKGHSKGQGASASGEQQERQDRILAYVRKNPKASIKGIAAVLPDCSEKTIQRELASLVKQGLVEKTGERRWSVYTAL